MYTYSIQHTGIILVYAAELKVTGLLMVIGNEIYFICEEVEVIIIIYYKVIKCYDTAIQQFVKSPKQNMHLAGIPSSSSSPAL